MKPVLSIVILSACLGAAACAPTPPASAKVDVNRSAQTMASASYCAERPDICTKMGTEIAGGAVFIEGPEGAVSKAPVALSDTNLKTDIRRVDQLESGINLYAFRYKGDTQTYVGVLAEELLADPRFAGAVSDGPDGYLQVDYSKIGVETVNGDDMARAGLGAIGRLAIKQRTPI